MSTNAWTYEGYWNAVLGADRDAARVVGEFDLVADGRENRIEEFLDAAERGACSEGRIERPDSWDGFRPLALAELTTAALEAES